MSAKGNINNPPEGRTPPPDPKDVTQLLADFHAGEDGAIDRLLPAVYAELRVLASRYLSRERDANTLQPTLLVNDAIMKLLGSNAPAFEDRSHFFGVAARAIRQTLVSHARDKKRLKRGGDAARVTLHPELLVQGNTNIFDLLDFEEALSALAAQNESFAKMVELRFFGGLEIGEVAEVLNTSKSTIERGLRVARAFLATQLADKAGGTNS